MRFVNRATDPNKGFTAHEICILEKRIYVNPENVFLEFLRTAGKKSNVLDTDFKSMQEYLDFQNDFEKSIESDSETYSNETMRCCFFIEYDYFKNKRFYFIKTGESGDPKVFYYSNGSIPVGTNLRDDRTEKIGFGKSGKNFTEFINYKTEQKYGNTTGKKLLQYAFMVLTFPVWLPFLIYAEIKKRF